MCEKLIMEDPEYHWDSYETCKFEAPMVTDEVSLSHVI